MNKRTLARKIEVAVFGIKDKALAVKKAKDVRKLAYKNEQRKDFKNA